MCAELAMQVPFLGLLCHRAMLIAHPMSASPWTSSLSLGSVLLGCAATSPPPSTPASPGRSVPSCSPASSVSSALATQAGTSQTTSAGSPMVTSAATSTVTPTTTPTAAAPAAPGSIVIGFDCRSTAEYKRDESLREWASGGPFGAAWNIEGWPLECETRLEAPCDATMHVRLFANARPLKAETRIVKRGAIEWRVEMPAERWSDALESQDLVFQTLAFTLAGVLVCEADGEHLPFADAFIAGVSGGE